VENKVSRAMPKSINEDRTSASAFPSVNTKIDSHHFSIFVSEKNFSFLSFCLKCSYICYQEGHTKRQMTIFASESALIKHLYSRGKGCTVKPCQQLLCYCCCPSCSALCQITPRVNMNLMLSVDEASKTFHDKTKQHQSLLRPLKQ